MKSSWRMQVTALCYLLPLLYTWSSNKSAYLSILSKEWHRIVLGGVLLGAHYGLWTLSLELTSVAHSLLFLCSTPLLIITYALLTRQEVKTLELVGTITGFVGMVVIIMQGKNQEGTTWYGDLVALAGNFAIWMHYNISERLMQHRPILYLFVLHVIGAVFCVAVSVLNSVVMEGNEGFSKITETFWYLYDIQGLYVVYLGVVVGFIGNGCFYYMLRHTTPFVLTIIISFEPLTGSIFAWVCKFQSEPTLITWIGGSIMFIGNSIATLASKMKNQDLLKDEKSVPLINLT